MTFGYRLYKGAWIYAGEPNEEQQLTREQMAELLRQGGVMVRNCYDFGTPEVTSFWYVIKDSFGGMEELSTNVRNQVRKSFKTMNVRHMTGQELQEEGYNVYVESAKDCKIATDVPSRKEFQQRIEKASQDEYWGCYDRETERLVAFSMNRVTEVSAEYKTMKALPEYRQKYAFYGLLYKMNEYYLTERGLRYVNDGSRSITEHSNIKPFLMSKFCFRKAYCHMTLQYKWWLGAAVKALYPLHKPIEKVCAPILRKRVSMLFSQEAMARNEI